MDFWVVLEANVPFCKIETRVGGLKHNLMLSQGFLVISRKDAVTIIQGSEGVLPYFTLLKHYSLI